MSDQKMFTTAAHLVPVRGRPSHSHTAIVALRPELVRRLQRMMQGIRSAPTVSRACRPAATGASAIPRIPAKLRLGWEAVKRDGVLAGRRAVGRVGARAASTPALSPLTAAAVASTMGSP